MKVESSHERKMARLNNSVITIKNISNEDFTHPYDRYPQTIKAGETLPFPYPVGMHLAKHLARKMAKQAFKLRDKGGKMDRKSVNMFNSTSVEPYMEKIVLTRTDKPLPAVKSSGEILNERTQEMQKNFPKEANKEVKVTKKQIIADLDKRKISYNPRDTVPVLL